MDKVSPKTGISDVDIGEKERDIGCRPDKVRARERMELLGYHIGCRPAKGQSSTKGVFEE
jgi:hypothetical protein